MPLSRPSILVGLQRADTFGDLPVNIRNIRGCYWELVARPNGSSTRLTGKDWSASVAVP